MTSQTAIASDVSALNMTYEELPSLALGELQDQLGYLQDCVWLATYGSIARDSIGPDWNRADRPNIDETEFVAIKNQIEKSVSEKRHAISDAVSSGMRLVSIHMNSPLEIVWAVSWGLVPGVVTASLIYSRVLAMYSKTLSVMQQQMAYDTRRTIAGEIEKLVADEQSDPNDIEDKATRINRSILLFERIQKMETVGSAGSGRTVSRDLPPGG